MLPRFSARQRRGLLLTITSIFAAMMMRFHFALWAEEAFLPTITPISLRGISMMPDSIAAPMQPPFYWPFMGYLPALRFGRRLSPGYSSARQPSLRLSTAAAPIAFAMSAMARYWLAIEARPLILEPRRQRASLCFSA